jgi:N-acetylmuramic acid 6-phosphate (MurNAc-6-P) etherase
VNPRTRNIDRLPLRAILERILDEDAGVPEAVRAELPAIERAGEILLDTLRSDGRWFNLGAGTSGRIGVLDAAEIPPSYSLSPERVQAIMAGGPDALSSARPVPGSFSRGAFAGATYSSPSPRADRRPSSWAAWSMHAAWAAARSG